ncbi:MAG: SGNH/GDSL hydrolase family protein [Clostridia bacterium]|nr:SGNH/GDSL hydrolase family protein [Clostridia bacterium]
MRCRSVQIWGDSIAKGVVYDTARGRYTILKESAVSLLSQEHGIAITNQSRMGRTAPEALELLSAQPFDALRGCAVVIEFGGNDCNHNWREVSDRPDLPHFPRVSPEEFEATLERMIRLISARGGFPVLCTLPPLDSGRFFHWVCQNGVSEENVLKFLGDPGRIYRWQEYYSSIAARAAAHEGCPCIPVREGFLKIPNPDRLLCADGMHPNQAGHRLIADVCAAWADGFEKPLLFNNKEGSASFGSRPSRVSLAM